MSVNFIDSVLEQVPATDTTVYTVPATVVSAQIIFGNCTAVTSDTLTINIVKSGGSVATTNRYVDTKNIAAGTPDPLSEIVGSVLKTGDFISADAVTASRLNLKIGIKEFTT